VFVEFICGPKIVMWLEPAFKQGKKGVI